MIIGIDGNEANTENRVGIGQFAFNVLCNLEKIDKNNQFLIYLKENPSSDFPKERKGWKYLVFGPKKYWTQFALPFKLLMQREKLGAFFSPSHYAPRFSPFPTIVSLMDLWHHRHPEQFNKKDLYQLINWEKYSVKNAEKIITISEFSKKEILDVYKISEEKVIVAYPGYTKFQIPNSKFQINSKVQISKEKYKINGEYFLYIGTLQPKKNIERLLKAFALLITNHQLPITLVIAGKKGWLYEKIFELVKELKLENKVVFTGFVSEEEKPYLIAGAKAFMLPSLYEGFGIPVLEAMSLGVPVIASNEGSLPEVGGESAIYCNPYLVESIAEAMAKLLNLNKNDRNEIIESGYKQCNKFSWEKCAWVILEAICKTK